MSIALRLSAVAGLLLALAACGPSEGAFVSRTLDIQCDMIFECYEDEADELFDSKKDCVDEYDNYTDDYADYYEDCDYDSGEARKCLKAYRSMPCEPDKDDWEEIGDACDDVWDC